MKAAVDHFKVGDLEYDAIDLALGEDAVFDLFD